MNGTIFILHMLGSASFGFAIYYDLYELHLPEHIHSRNEGYGGQVT